MPAIVVGIRTDYSQNTAVRTVTFSSPVNTTSGTAILHGAFSGPPSFAPNPDMQQSGLWSFFILTLIALAGFVGGLPALDSNSPVDCTQFRAPGQCVRYTGYPTQINGINVDLYHYADGWTTPNPTGDLNIAAIDNATRTVLPLFSPFAPPFNVTIVLVTALPPPNTAAASTSAGTPCHVLIKQKSNNGTDPSFSLKHAIAHELYHCVEFRNQGQDYPVVAGVGWLIEGAAEYFANTVYRDISPTSFIKAYDPNLSLYNQAQTLDVRASIFFQFLSNQGWGDYTINAFVIQQFQAIQNGTSELTIMSSNADLQRLFPIFAQKFSGLAVTFPDGRLAQGSPGTPINQTEILLTDLESDGQQHLAQVTVPSFAMKIYTATLQPGITYSIQWSPLIEDGKTFLAYQQAFTIPGYIWTTFNPATPLQIPIDCSSNPVQYRFLLTSTAGVDVSQGQLLVVRQSSQSCGCNDVGISLDPCLSGNWTLDLNDFQTYLEGRLAALQAVTVTNLVTSGASTFELPAGGMGGMTFSNLDVGYDATSSGYSFHTTINITGSVSGRMVMQAAGRFCWADGQGQGQADTSTTVAGLSGPYNLDVPIATAYVAPTITVNYTCSATSLQLVGSDSGQYAWAMSYVKD